MSRWAGQSWHARAAAALLSAAMLSLAAHPAPAAEPAVISEDRDSSDLDDENGESSHDESEGEFTFGGEGQTVSPDGVIIPGQGA